MPEIRRWTESASAPPPARPARPVLCLEQRRVRHLGQRSRADVVVAEQNGDHVRSARRTAPMCVQHGLRLRGEVDHDWAPLTAWLMAASRSSCSRRTPPGRGLESFVQAVDDIAAVLTGRPDGLVIRASPMVPFAASASPIESPMLNWLRGTGQRCCAKKRRSVPASSWPRRRIPRHIR